jgi:hypothetical protein
VEEIANGRSRVLAREQIRIERIDRVELTGWGISPREIRRLDGRPTGYPSTKAAA